MYNNTYPTPVSTPPHFYQVHPQPAAPYHPPSSTTTAPSQPLEMLIQHQIEYYFSVDNLCRDIYFRSQMDSEGFVSIEMLAGFNRVKTLTSDVKIIKEALDKSTVVEVIDMKCRRRGDYGRWILNNDNTIQPTTTQSIASTKTNSINSSASDLAVSSPRIPEPEDHEDQEIVIFGADKAGTVPNNAKVKNNQVQDKENEITVG
ncbi:hypothetical protein BKA69DRAFT_1033171 [Paraphysoderma sedebokerense]|nr:hypothetical protein BKA69DRAFT_1033171 [Paraphysoderma sedebokerense]